MWYQLFQDQHDSNDEYRNDNEDEAPPLVSAKEAKDNVHTLRTFLVSRECWTVWNICIGIFNVLLGKED